MGLFTPALLGIYQYPVVKLLPDPASALLSGAGFNIAYLIFFLLLFVLFRKRLKNS